MSSSSDSSGTVSSAAPATPESGIKRLFVHLITPGTLLPAVSASAYGLLVMAMTILVPVGTTAIFPTSDGPVRFLGYFDSHLPNWWLMPILLPASILALRWLWTSLTSGAAGESPIAALVRDCGGNGSAVQYELVKRLMPTRLLIYLGIGTIVLNALDFWSSSGKLFLCARPLYGPTHVHDPCYVHEADWTVMALANNHVPVALNLVFDLVAYIQQLFLTYMAMLIVPILVLHNWYFLSLVYLRYSRTQNTAPIRVRPLDYDHSFGFRIAHVAFNVQVKITVIVGLFILTSRWRNTSDEYLELVFDKPWPKEMSPEKLFQWLLGLLSNATPSDLFGDIGQLLLATGWLTLLIVISLPAWVKFLPLRYPECRSAVVAYLRCLLPDGEWIPSAGTDDGGRWSFGEHPKTEEVNKVTAAFRLNGYWPTGNDQAERLFTFAFWVALNIVIPLASVRHLGGTIVAQLILLVVAWSASKLALSVFQYSIRGFHSDL